MDKEQELRPCPCGHTQPTQMMAREICRDMASPLWQQRQTRIWCLGCGATIIKADADEAIAAWNRRSSDEQAEVVAALERGEVLPKLANCGHYLAEDNTGQWHYINHANTWQTYPGPTTPEARAIAYASPPAVAKGGVTEAMVDLAWRRLNGAKYITPDDVRAALTAALAVGDEGIREGWQPISTVPKDGTEIQAFVRTDEGAEMQQIVHWDGAPTAEWPWQVNDGSALSSRPVHPLAPPPHSSITGRRGMKLTLPLKAEYFDQIKAGTKPDEYRLRTEYWRKRLVGRTYGSVVLTKGYPSRDDTDRRLELPWRGFRETIITHPHFGAEPVEVFAIDVTGRFEATP